jgi:hypothetical protein
MDLAPKIRITKERIFTFSILEPNVLPAAKPGDPIITADTSCVNSGNDVPAAKSTVPTQTRPHPDFSAITSLDMAKNIALMTIMTALKMKIPEATGRLSSGKTISPRWANYKEIMGFKGRSLMKLLGMLFPVKSIQLTLIVDPLSILT